MDPIAIELKMSDLCIPFIFKLARYAARGTHHIAKIRYCMNIIRPRFKCVEIFVGLFIDYRFDFDVE